MKKSLFFGAAALSLLVLFTFVGCSNPTSDDNVVYYAGIEGEVITAARLVEVLADDGVPGTYALIAQDLSPAAGVSSILGGAGVTVIPYGVTLNLYGNFALAGDVVVGGVLNVQPGSTLSTDTGKVLTIGRLVGETGGYPQGQVNVRDGATLEALVDATTPANTEILFAYGNVIAGEEPNPVPLTPAQIIAAAKKGLISGDSDHGESPAVHLSFGNDSVYLTATPVPVSTVLDLKDLANGIFSTSIVVQAAVTEKVENLTIRKNTAVTLAGNTVVLTPTGTLTVNGSLTTAGSNTSAIGAGLTRVVVGKGGAITASQTGDTSVDVTELVVDGDFTSTTARFIALTAASGTGSLTLGAGWDFGSKADPLLNIKTVISPALTITANNGFTVPLGSTLSLTGATVAPTGDITVNGTISLAGTTALTILADKTLDITGTVALAAGSTASVILTTGATPTDPGAKITGTGKLTAQDLELSGGTGGWAASLDTGTAAETVTIASTTTGGVATITGSTSVTTASLIGGEGAAILQKNSGTAANTLTLVTVSVDLSTAGTITLAGGATTPAKLTLTDEDVTIKTGTGTGGTALTSLTKIGGGSITSLVLSGGSETVDIVYAAGDPTTTGTLASITADGTNKPAVITVGGADTVVFEKDVEIEGAN
jgi:hypothetical protein